MPTALGVLGGIAASPFRLAGMAAKGTAKLGYRGAKTGLKATALAAMDVSGALPIFAAAAGLAKGAKKGITAGYDVGKKLLKPVGEGTVAEDSALAAIAAAASETSKIQAETAKIEAETNALTGEKKAEKDRVEAQTTMGGVDVEILEKIYGETVSIRGILGGKDPESEKKELALDEQVRHKNFLKALSALGFDGGDKEEKKSWFDLPNLMGMVKGLVPAIIAGLGIAGLIKLWPKIATSFEGIADAVANINEFLDDMSDFFRPITDWLNSVDPAKLAAGAGALRGTKTVTGSRALQNKAKMMAAKDAERSAAKKLKKEQAARRNKAAQLRRDRANSQSNAAKKRIAAHKTQMAADKLRKQQAAMRGSEADNVKSVKKFNLKQAALRIGKGLGGGMKLPAGFKMPVIPKVSIGKSWRQDKVPSRVVPPKVKIGKSWRQDKVPSRVVPLKTTPFDGDTAAGKGKVTLPKVIAAVTRMFSGDEAGGKGKVSLPKVVTPKISIPKVLGADVHMRDVLRQTVAGTGVRKAVTTSGGTPIQKGPLMVDMLDKPVVKAPQYEKPGGPDRTKGPDKVIKQGTRGLWSRAPYVNPNTGQRMYSKFHWDEKVGGWRDVSTKNARMGLPGTLVPENVAVDYLQKSGVEFKPEKGGFKSLTTKQLRFMGEKPGLMARIKGTTRWGGKAAGLLSIVFIGWAIKNAFQQWQKDKPADDHFPLNENSEADTAFRKTLARLAAAFGVGWVAAILAGKLGFLLGGPVGAFFGALLGGFAAGMAADQITGWLQGEGVEQSGVAGVSEGWKKKVEEAGGGISGTGKALFDITGGNMLMALPGMMMEGIEASREDSNTETLQYQTDIKALQTLELSIKNIMRKKNKGRKLKAFEQKKLDAALPQIEALRKKTTRKGSLGGGTTYVPTHKEQYGGGGTNIQSILGESSLGATKLEDPTGGQAALDPNLQGPNEYSAASLGNNLQTNPETIGTTLTALGKNGGQPSADIVITNINSTTNSDHQQVSSTASTSNIITIDKAPSYSPMRSRFAV